MALHELGERYCSSVRIWNAAAPVGVGFLVGERHIMTCAHVVADALGDRKRFVDAPCPDETVRFDFVCSPAAKGDALPTAKPVAAAWRPQSNLARPSDIAVLEIEQRVVLPPKARLVRVCPHTYADDRYSAYVIKSGLLEGTYVQGTFTGDISEERTEVLADRSDVAIARGCSGAALWNMSRPEGGIAGMIVEMQSQTQGRIIPIEVLRQVWPAMPKIEASSDGPVAEAPSSAPRTSRLAPRLSAMLHTFDRQLQTTEFELALDTSWATDNRPVVCAILGADEDRPMLCRDRCLKVSVRQRLDRSDIGGDGPIPKKIEWPNPAEHGVAYVRSRLIQQVRTELRAKDASPAEIRLAYNTGVTPYAFFSLLQERDFTPLHKEVIAGWASFWREVGTEKLNKPLAVLVLCQLNETTGPGLALGQMFKELGTPAFADVHPLPRLNDFTFDDVKDWLVEKRGDLGIPHTDLDDRVVPHLRKSRLFGNQAHRMAALEEWIDQLPI